jgi:hypothetical protein
VLAVAVLENADRSLDQGIAAPDHPRTTVR